MARSNLHEIANRLLQSLYDKASDGTFEGKLSEVAAAAGLNSVRSSEAIRLLEQLGRIEVLQRGRRGRETVVALRSQEEVSVEEAAQAGGGRAAKRGRFTYEEIGRAVVDRLIELGRDDGLRAAQVEAFANENAGLKDRIAELESELSAAERRETQLRIEVKSIKEALDRNEENLRRMFAGDRTAALPEHPADDAETRAVLDILRSGGGA